MELFLYKARKYKGTKKHAAGFVVNGKLLVYAQNEGYCHAEDHAIQILKKHFSIKG